MSDSEDPTSISEEDITAEDIRELVETRKEEVELEKEKQITRRQELESEERQAKRALEAQIEDRERQRDYQDRIDKRNQRYGLAIIILLLIFFGYLVWQGETQMVFEIIRILVYGGAGWFAGNSVGKAQAERQSVDGSSR